MILKISAMHFDLNNNSARQRLEALIQAIEAPDDSVNTCNQLAQRLNQLKQKDIPFTFISSRHTRQPQQRPNPEIPWHKQNPQPTETRATCHDNGEGRETTKSLNIPIETRGALQHKSLKRLRQALIACRGNRSQNIKDECLYKCTKKMGQKTCKQPQ